MIMRFQKICNILMTSWAVAVAGAVAVALALAAAAVTHSFFSFFSFCQSVPPEFLR